MDTKTKKERQYELIGQWEQSGLTQQEFCENEGISLAAFGYWRTKYLAEQRSEGGPSDGFVPMKVSQGERLEVCYPNGVSIKLPASTSPSQLRSLISLY
ncbi:MAG: hypothetical protein OEX02_19970 [Cyclobacteriaceae bacterium]|nr:hypothetical protein [Cyclobacteriaceae bacterium]